MATIVNTTEVEPTLAVVRFTAELAWADAGSEVVKAEVGRLCLEAQEHILAARWAEMASLMLASADLLLNSSRIPDKGISPVPRFLPSKRLPVLELSQPHVLSDLECILSVICNLVTKAGSEAEAMQIAKSICEKLNHKPDDKPALRLKV
jgi:translation initiation factor 3 subunit M